jgi:hypothetical protein
MNDWGDWDKPVNTPVIIASLFLGALFVSFIVMGFVGAFHGCRKSILEKSQTPVEIVDVHLVDEKSETHIGTTTTER